MGKRIFTISVLLLLVLGWLFWGPVDSVRAGSWTVTKTADTNDGTCDGDCSLREAIVAAGSGDTINFDYGLSGATITLGSTITIDKSLTINGGSLGGHIKISGDNSVRIFSINSGLTVELIDIDLIDGR